MRLFYCRSKENPEAYMGRLLTTRDGYTLTSVLEEVTFSGDRAAMEETVAKYPELEVCCLDSEPVVVTPLYCSARLAVPEADGLDLMVADIKLRSALEDFQKVRPVMFTEMDDNGAISEFSDVSYDATDDRIYIELEYPRGKPQGYIGSHSV